MALISGSLLPLLFSFIAGSNDTVKYYTEVVEKGIENAIHFKYPTNAYSYKPKEKGTHDFGSFDFIIVGAGTAGCVIANRLTEVSEWSVLVVEAGDYGDDFVDIPNMHSVVHATKYNWGYYTTPQTTACLGMVDRQCNLPRGKGVGGSTLINGCMYVRGNRWDFDRWAELGNTEWSYERVLPYFKKAETFKVGNPKYHGHHGPMHVEYTRPYSPQCLAFVQANEEVGQKLLDYNGKEELGIAFTQFNNIKGHREDTGKAYIRPFLKRKNLHVQINSYVTKILFEDDHKTARGIHFTYNGKNYIATAKKEVIVAGGAINSPPLLMLSGIGPHEELEKFKIPIYKELPAVGKNLIDHAACLFLDFVMDYREPNRTVEEYVREFLRGTGLYTIAGNTQALGFIHTRLAEVPESVPDIEFIISPSPTINELTRKFYHITDETYEALFGNEDPLKLFRVFVILLHPRSAGTVRLQSADPFDYPLIDSQFLSDPEGHDIASMYEGIEYILKLLETKAFKKWNARLLPGDLPACRKYKQLSKEFWYCYLRQTTQNIYHPMGTNKMGQNKTTCVVNSRLKVHDIEKLRIADASIFPTSVSGHTSAASVMTGELVSDFIKEEYSVGG